MRVCHLAAFPASGMYSVARTLAVAECRIGLESKLVNVHDAINWDEYVDYDVYVTHTHFPTELRKRVPEPKMVFVSHGTPEYIVQSALDGTKQGYGAGDGLQLWMYWMKVADATVTFWPRHQAIMRSMCDKRTQVHLAPLGLDIDFWKAGKSKGKFAGKPSVMTAENSHFMKWAYDMFVCWGWINRELPDACLHATYVPQDQHRVWFPILDRNGCAFGAHVSPITWPHEELRHVLNSVDFYWNGVRYGDFNRIGMEAALCGAKVISYRGNPYSYFWVNEGDQRGMATELIEILKGQREPRVPDAIPTDVEMAESFKAVYEGIA